MYCTNCRAKLEDDSVFCPVCGTPVNREKASGNEKDNKNEKAKYEKEPREEEKQNPMFTGMQIRNYNPDLDYKPIGMWGYFFYTILLNIPVVGWIFIILFSLGVTKNINLRNFARSWFCVYIVGIIFFVIKLWPYVQLVSNRMY